MSPLYWSVNLFGTSMSKKHSVAARKVDIIIGPIPVENNTSKISLLVCLARPRTFLTSPWSIQAMTLHNIPMVSKVLDPLPNGLSARLQVGGAQ